MSLEQDYSLGEEWQIQNRQVHEALDSLRKNGVIHHFGHLFVRLKEAREANPPDGKSLKETTLSLNRQYGKRGWPVVYEEWERVMAEQATKEQSLGLISQLPL